MAREIRNRYIECLEKSFQALICLLAIFGLIIVITGIAFISSDVNKDGSYHVDGVEELALGLVLLFAIITFYLTCFGIVIVKRRSCHVCCVALFGFCMFFGVFLIAMIQGVGFTQLGSIEADEIQEYCALGPRQMRMKTNMIVSQFFGMAHDFDDISTHLVERYMCTEVCPCRDYGSNPSTKELFAQQLQQFENEGKMHNRTFDENDNTKIFMNFTENEGDSFTSFADCFDFWEDFASRDPMVNLNEIFRVDLPRKRGRGGRRGGRKGRYDDDDDHHDDDDDDDDDDDHDRRILH